jgi:hypothetical protein
MKNNLIVAIVISLVVGGGIGYFVGKHSSGPKQISFNGETRQLGSDGKGGDRFMARSGNGSTSGMRPVAGEIISKDDTSITVKMPDGSSKIVLVSDKTSVNKSATGTLSDLKTGEQVAAFGIQNSDGSVTAQSVQLNPQMRMFVKPSAKESK